MYHRHAKSILNHFHTNCLRKLLKIRWQDKSQIQKSWRGQGCKTPLTLAQLRWTGHITRVPDERLPKTVFYGELQVGIRTQGGRKKRCKNTLKPSLEDFNIPPESWEHTAQDRAKCCSLIRKGTDDYEAKRVQCWTKAQRAKNQIQWIIISESSSSELTWVICNRQFRAEICLICHQCTIYEPCHEIMVRFVLRKLMLQTRMGSHPMGLDVWFFGRSAFILYVCEQRSLWRDCACADAQARLSLRWSPMW